MEGAVKELRRLTDPIVANAAFRASTRPIAGGMRILITEIIPWLVWIIPSDCLHRKETRVRDYCWLRGGSGSSYMVGWVTEGIAAQILAAPEATNDDGVPVSYLLELLQGENTNRAVS